jgi:hypothetical protein
VVDSTITPLSLSSFTGEIPPAPAPAGIADSQLLAAPRVPYRMLRILLCSGGFEGGFIYDVLDLPRSAAAFEVNSEPHTGARPSVRLCVGLRKIYTAFFLINK